MFAIYLSLSILDFFISFDLLYCSYCAKSLSLLKLRGRHLLPENFLFAQSRSGPCRPLRYRQDFSLFDGNGDVLRAKVQDQNFNKPLIEHIEKMDKKLRWFIPTSFMKRKLYVSDEDERLTLTLLLLLPL